MPILDRLGIDKAYWLKAMQPEGLKLNRAIGCLNKLKQYAERVGCAWLHGETQSKHLYHGDVVC
ncbi:hypothetical protein BTE48_10965 [Oceanospirillum multiglobuliferum]|uniref:Uncharacterized protein n=1 Tax=Oceanospirillum multiglobuliferum TaxID=64969 RepID=A0A1V4T330_9GAMM|nr:hypothetical protein BTE48_10965 [Oceanospirillum multiglobuliferum]